MGDVSFLFEQKAGLDSAGGTNPLAVTAPHTIYAVWPLPYRNVHFAGGLAPFAAGTFFSIHFHMVHADGVEPAIYSP